jgi:predicted N-acetyltransferase YhbS
VLLRRHTMHPRGQPELIQVAVEGGAIVGCTMAAHIRLRLGAAVLECGSLILVVPEQRKWLAEPLLGACLPALADQGAGLVLMQGSALEFAELGLMPYRYHEALTLPQNIPEEGRVALRPATPDDRNDLAALYDAMYAAMPLSELRTQADWRVWPYNQTLILEDTRRRAVAYLYRTHGAIVEAAAADAGAARSLLMALGSERPSLNLPAAHPVVRAALQLGGELRTRSYRPEQEAPLAGVLDVSEALDQLVPELASRLASSRYAGWEGVVRLETEGDWVGIAFEGSNASVIAGSVAADLRLRRVSLTGLAQLLLGHRAVSDLRATGDLSCDDTALGLLEAVFPVV